MQQQLENLQHDVGELRDAMAEDSDLEDLPEAPELATGSLPMGPGLPVPFLPPRDMLGSFHDLHDGLPDASEDEMHDDLHVCPSSMRSARLVVHD